MSDVTFTIQNIDQFRADMARMSDPGKFRDLVHALGIVIETAFKKYPTRNSPSRASVYGSAFASEKQRRYFFWALRSGAIQVPYRRGQSPGSRNLQQSWTTRMLTDTSVEIGTAVPYGTLLMDAGRQSKYAEAVGWRTVQQDMIDVTPQLQRGLESGVAKILGV